MLEHLKQPCCGLVRLERAEPDGERDAPHPSLVPLERPRSPEYLVGLHCLCLCRSPVPRLDVRDGGGTDEHLRGGVFLCPPALVPHRDQFFGEHAPFFIFAAFAPVIFTAPARHFTPPHAPPRILTPAAAPAHPPRHPQNSL